MQPYFFPYLGYFQLMNAVDNWIIFDDVQFIDKGWINRNRVLHPDPEKGWQYITIPLSKKGQFDKINKIEIKSDIKWKSQILGKLTIYKNLNAPYYHKTYSLVKKCLDTDENNLSNFLTRSIKIVAQHLNISTPIKKQSELKLSLQKPNHPGQWALQISEKLGASEYINPVGGYNIFDEKEFLKKNIKLNFLKPNLTPYKQSFRKDFNIGLSILDVLMFNSKDELQEMLISDFEILKKKDFIL